MTKNLVQLAANPEPGDGRELVQLAAPITFMQSAMADHYTEKRGDPAQLPNFAVLFNKELGLEMDVSAVGPRESWFVRVYQPSTGRSALLGPHEPYSRQRIQESLERIQ